MASPLKKHRFESFCLLACFCVLSNVCNSETQDAVCTHGSGSFASTSATGVTVSVGAVKNEGFARRVCEARLMWDKQRLQVEPQAWQVDVDVMGADLGLGTPVVALQIKKSDVDSLVRYEIYSLTKPPRKLRTITGGDIFRASDTNLDGHIEIWTSDAGTVDGFERLPLSALDFAPAIALRFENRRLVDVSSEFQSHYDRQIETLRSQLDARQLSEFKSSDGNLSTISPLNMEEKRRLVATKIKVLEVVWSYLYSGREQDAWKALADMWPSADFDRIRTSIQNAREHGIRSEVDGVSNGLSHPYTEKHESIFNETPDSPTDDQKLAIDALHQSQLYSFGKSNNATHTDTAADTKPMPILFMIPPPPENLEAALKEGVVVSLVIDSAGKVWSAQADAKLNTYFADASAGWKFVPALKGGHPVASRLRLMVRTSQ